VGAVCTVEYRDRWFWVYDVSLSILLAETAEVAERSMTGDSPKWLPDMIRRMRISAIDTDSGFYVHRFDEDQIKHLVDWLLEAARRLRDRRRITAKEAAQWYVIDGDTINWRDDDVVDTEPTAQLGEAIVQMIEGPLPPAPAGTQWYYGRPGAPLTIPRIPKSG
jgi:hypothetical protein